jgi:RNA polymerase sigma-B factor
VFGGTPDDSTAVSDQHPDLTEEFLRAREGDRRARNRIVEAHMGFASFIARRYSGARSAEDVRQAAMVGLIKAVDRFDPSLGHAFTAFAGATIEGEVKRFFRDTTWSVRVPRSAKELYATVTAAIDALSQRLGRSPSVDEIAQQLEVSADDVLRAMSVGSAKSASSINTPSATGRAHDEILDGGDDRDAVTDTILLETLMSRLPERERQIVELRFFAEKSQAEIAEIVGISQMHVSRLLKASFERMRALAGDGE